MYVHRTVFCDLYNIWFVMQSLSLMVSISGVDSKIRCLLILCFVPDQVPDAYLGT